MRELPTYPPSSDPLSPAHPEIPGTGQDLVCKPQLYVHCTPRLPDYGDTDMRVERTPGPPGRRPRPHCQPTKSLLPTIKRRSRLTDERIFPRPSPNDLSQQLK